MLHLPPSCRPAQNSVKLISFLLTLYNSSLLLATVSCNPVEIAFILKSFDSVNNQSRQDHCRKMSFSTLVSDIAFRDTAHEDRDSQISRARSQVTARSLASTRATSVSISGDISSQLHAGYSHPLARSWQAERQLTKVWTQLQHLLSMTCLD